MSTPHYLLPHSYRSTSKNKNFFAFEKLSMGEKQSIHGIRYMNYAIIRK